MNLLEIYAILDGGKRRRAGEVAWKEIGIWEQGVLESKEEGQGGLSVGPQVTPELVSSRWGDILSMEEADSPESHQEAAGEVMARIAVSIGLDSGEYWPGLR